MARTPKGQFSELIEVDDLRDNPNRAEKAVDDDVGVSVWSKKQGRNATYYRQVHELLDDKIDEAEVYAKKARLGFNPGIAYRLTKFTEKAIAEPHKDIEGYQRHREGKTLMELKNPGCRVWLTQAELCEKLKCSRSALTDTLRAMKAVDLIVNWGEGWIEFDCLCVWRGKIELKMAYSRVQKVHQSKRCVVVGGSNG
ncbi:MAG: hypothetical protein ACMVY4_06800 [Minwuia sp.]|uniref:hypothetical protein n=1 Tax=Minwuia sp. TaxID=2493630 RepID=UPI003A837CFC